jgi:hypothetical protein
MNNREMIILVDLYEVTETLKRFNEMLNEVGGSL